MDRGVVESDAVLADIEVVAHLENAHRVVYRRPPDTLSTFAQVKQHAHHPAAHGGYPGFAKWLAHLATKG